MASSVSSRVIVGKNLQQNVSILRKMFPSLARDAVNEHAINVQRRAKENITRGAAGVTASPAVDTGRLRSSIKIEMFSNGYAARVGSDVDYAPHIEFGTGPRSKMPPLEPIRQWCRRHNIPQSAAYAIALKIKRNGTPAKPFLFPAYELERGNFERVVMTHVQQIGQMIV